jgi:hypothetical protein
MLMQSIVLVVQHCVPDFDLAKPQDDVRLQGNRISHCYCSRKGINDWQKRYLIMRPTEHLHFGFQDGLQFLNKGGRRVSPKRKKLNEGVFSSSLSD